VHDRLRAAVLTASCLAVALTVATGCEAAYLTVPIPPNASEAAHQLDTLTVASQHSMRGYRRDRFAHWSDQGDECDTREVVLRRDGQNVTTGGSCNPVRGTWRSRYDGLVLRNPRSLDIDHMVPLANAWRSGADQWTDARRKAFANDLISPELIAVSQSSNRSKGDQSPDQWRPTNIRYWCTYARSWIAVKYEWNLSVTRAEKRALRQMLASC